MALHWTSTLLKIFSQSVNFQGGEPCPKKPGCHLRISVHIREEQSFDFIFFLYLVMAATVVFVVISAGRAACGKAKARG